jgi:hypothetical protein
MVNYMKQSTVGYCWKCRKNTEHKVIECQDSVRQKVFETIFTHGFSLLFPRNYSCKCAECGNIQTLRF